MMPEPSTAPEPEGWDPEEEEHSPCPQDHGDEEFSFLQSKGLSFSYLYFIPAYTIFIMVYTGIYHVIPSIYWYIPCYTWYILVYTITVYSGIYYHCVQDIIVVVPPFPYCIEEDRHDVPLEDCWYARPQLFFKCCLRPKHGREPKNSTYKADPGIYMYILVCTFLTISYQMICCSNLYFSTPLRNCI